MAQLDTSIAFSGYVPNFANALASGAQAAAMRNEMSRQNALAQAMQTHGAGLVNGDPQAMNALAVFDPAMVMGVQDTRQGMDARALQMDATRQDMTMQAQQWAMQLDDRQAAEAREGIARAIMMMDEAVTPQQWDVMAQQLGKPELVGQFALREQRLSEALPFADALARRDQMRQPAENTFIVAGEDAAQFGLPTSGQPYQVTITPNGVEADAVGSMPAPATNINVNTGGNSNAFTKAMDEAAAGRFGEYIDAGARATELQGDLQMLSQLASQINTGVGAQITAALGPIAQELGVEIEGLGEMQAFQSIVDRLAPALRPPGSGASSDFDARQFLSSLPSLGRTPEGNRIINETFAAIMQHRQAVAQIAAETSQRGKSWQDAEARIRALGNPFQAFNAYNQSAVQPDGASGFTPIDAAPRADAPPVVVTQEDYDALPSGTIFTDETGAQFRKP